MLDDHGDFRNQFVRDRPACATRPVLNADFRPLSYYPLSLWPGRRRSRRCFWTGCRSSPNMTRWCGQGIRYASLGRGAERLSNPRSAWHSRASIFRRRILLPVLRRAGELTFDRGAAFARGVTSWENVVAARSPCNLKRPTSR